MEDFVNQLLSILPSPLRGAAQSIVDRILAVWHNVTDFWGRVRGGWQRLRNAAWGRIQAQLRHAYALAITLRWIITVYVPRIASQWATAVQQEARQLYRQAVDVARADLASARAFLSQQVDTISSWASQWFTWIRDHVAHLEDDGKRLLDHVFGPLASPERLASWAIGAIITAGVNWLEDNAVALSRRLVAQRARIVLNSLGFFEDLVSRIF